MFSSPFPGAPGRTFTRKAPRPARQAMAAKLPPRNLRQAAARNLRPGSPFVPREAAGVPGPAKFSLRADERPTSAGSQFVPRGAAGVEQFQAPTGRCPRRGGPLRGSGERFRKRRRGAPGAASTGKIWTCRQAGVSPHCYTGDCYLHIRP